MAEFVIKDLRLERASMRNLGFRSPIFVNPESIHTQNAELTTSPRRDFYIWLITGSRDPIFPSLPPTETAVSHSEERLHSSGLTTSPKRFNTFPLIITSESGIRLNHSAALSLCTIYSYSATQSTSLNLPKLSTPPFFTLFSPLDVRSPNTWEVSWFLPSSNS